MTKRKKWHYKITAEMCNGNGRYYPRAVLCRLNRNFKRQIKKCTKIIQEQDADN